MFFSSNDLKEYIAIIYILFSKMYELNGKVFQKKSPALLYAKNYINNNIPYDQDIDLESENGKFLLDLIAYHPNLDEKQGDGIVSFKKIKNAFGYGYSLQILRADDTTDIFSYKVCLDYHFDDLAIAMRQAIKPSRDKWRNENKSNSTCALCNIINIDDFGKKPLEVDHKTIPFAEIKNRFIKQTKLPPPSFIHCIDVRWKFDDASQEYEKDWIKFHDSLADYQFLCSNCNVKKSNKIDYTIDERNKDIKPYKNISTLYINLNDF